MPQRRVNIDLLNLLEEVVAKQNPTLKPVLDAVQSQSVTSEQRELLREMIVDEFVDTGLDANDEPNDRGRKLEDLIDWLWHISGDGDDRLP